MGLFPLNFSPRFLIFLILLSTNYSSAGEKICFDCHDNPLLKSGPHEGALWGCETCHAPHQGYGGPAGLVAKVDQLCFSCHSRKAILGECSQPDGSDCGHPVNRHPVIKKKDPLYPKREFTCVSCHNPHSSDQPHLFRYNYRAETSPYKGVLCAVCHWSKTFGGPKPATPPWN